ncbi:MAG: hypothetical protein OXC92_05175 [Flavobacteriaceae bacterium]|nr:hypothetical protein [Flavobacteriaceae bacterium]MCY4216360.1 hypothetical protein [Flavobacteriaceae bacterium]
MKKKLPKIKPYDYQPNKKELEEDVRIDTSPEELIRRVLRPLPGFKR